MVPELEDEKDLKRARKVLSKGREVVGPGYSRLSGDAARVVEKEKSQVTLSGLTEFTGNTTRIGGQIGLLGIIRVTGMDARVGGQTGLLETAGETRTTTRVGG
jgi:hypothetical protein